MRIILSSRFASYIQNEVHFCINIFTFHHVLFDCTICFHRNTTYRDIRWGQWNSRGYCVNRTVVNNWTWRYFSDRKWATIDIHIPWSLGIYRFTRSNEFEILICYSQGKDNNISSELEILNGMLLTLSKTRARWTISNTSYNSPAMNNSTRDTIWFKTWLQLLIAESKDIFDVRNKLLEDDNKCELENWRRSQFDRKYKALFLELIIKPVFDNARFYVIL